MGNACLGICWVLIWIFFSFLVAFFCFFFFLILYTIEGFKCCSCLKEVNDILRKGVEFPNMCAENASKNLC